MTIERMTRDEMSRFLTIDRNPTTSGRALEDKPDDDDDAAAAAATG